MIESEPLSWQKMQILNGTINSYKIPRTSSVKNLYEKYRNEVKIRAENYSLEDDIFYHYPQLAKGCLILSRNKFPYHLDPNITQLILWIPKQYACINSLILMKMVSRELEILFRGLKMIIFENHDTRKSIPGIRHFHILIDLRSA